MLANEQSCSTMVSRGRHSRPHEYARVRNAAIDGSGFDLHLWLRRSGVCAHMARMAFPQDGGAIIRFETASRRVRAWGLLNPTRYRDAAAEPLQAWEHEQQEVDADAQTCL